MIILQINIIIVVFIQLKIVKIVLVTYLANYAKMDSHLSVMINLYVKILMI